MGTACSGQQPWRDSHKWRRKRIQKSDLKILSHFFFFFFIGMKNVKPILVNILFLRLF